MAYKDPEKQKEYQRKWEKENRRGKRHKVWTGIFYEDSSEGWRDEAEELGLPFCVSPLHDQDVWTKTDERKNPEHVAGNLKEPHRHFLVEYPQPVDYETVKQDFSFLSGGKHLKFAKSKASMALYLCHIGSEDKAVYDAAEVLEFGGANWRDWCAELDNIHATMKEMRAWLNANADIHEWEFSDFVDWCDENNDEWSRALDLKCSWAISHYMDKRRNKISMKRKAHRAAMDLPPDDEPWMGGGVAYEPLLASSAPEPTNKVGEPTNKVGEPTNKVDGACQQGEICPTCGCRNSIRYGKTAGGKQKYMCKECCGIFVEETQEE